MKCLALFVRIGFVYAINIFHVNLTKFHINRQENEANLEWSNGIKKAIDLKKDSISDDCIYKIKLNIFNQVVCLCKIAKTVRSLFERPANGVEVFY